MGPNSGNGPLRTLGQFYPRSTHFIIIKKNFHVEEKLSLYHKDVQQLDVSKTSYPTEWTKDEERRAQLLARGWEGGFRNFRGVEEQTTKGRGCIYNVFGKITVSLAVQSGLGGSAI